jgi:uncharacterized protein YdeI (BOF family)
VKSLVAIALSGTILAAGSVIPQIRQSPAEAQTVEPLTVANIPIRELRQRQLGLTIAGEITSVVGNEFILSDGTGQIVVDAGPMWYHQLNLQVGEQVTVVGKYDDYDFDAFTITRSNGEVLTIRPPQGPPPWAGGPRRRR